MTGTLEGATPGEVLAHLRREQLVPVRIQRAGQGFSLPAGLFRLPRAARGRHVAEFARLMAALLDAGIPLERALSLAAGLHELRPLARVLHAVREDVVGGVPLSGALERRGLFSPFVVNVVRAGEEAGLLAEALGALHSVLERQQKLQERVTASLTYPCVVLAAGCLAVAVFVAVVVPAITGLLAGWGGGALPLPTRVLLAAAGAAERGWWAGPGAVVLALLSATLALGSDTGARRADAWKLRMPLAGPVLRQAGAAQFARTAGTLLNRGVPVVQALRVARQTLGNRVLAVAVDDALRRVAQGGDLSGALRDTGRFPPLLADFLRVGEETGRLAPVLLQAADFFEAEVDRALKRLTTWLEPALILLVAGVVTFVVLAMLLPLVEMTQLPVP